MKRILALLLTGLFAAGCGQNSTSTSTPTTTPASNGTSTGSSAPATTGTTSASSGKKLTIGMLPKSKGNPYFDSCDEGGQKAADELGDTLIFDGPTKTDPGKQAEIVENWINSGVDVITVSAENKDALSDALRQAEAKGIKVVSFDADVDSDARSFFVNQGTAKAIGYALMDEAARACDKSGEFAIITATTTAANQNEWKKYIDEDLKNYPNMKLVDFRPCNDDQNQAQQVATQLMTANPDLKLIMPICSPGVPGAAEAVKQANKTGKVHIVGLGMPKDKSNIAYVNAGVIDSIILWDTNQLGYLTVEAADALAKGTLKKGDKEFKVGSTTYQIDGDNILLGQPTTYNKDNINK